MTYGSVCSGVESISLAWMPLGFQPAWFAEIDPFCCRLLEHRFPRVSNYGDVTKIQHPKPVDVLAGGTPCQSFSVAGRRQGIRDPRGNLTLEFLRLAKEIRPRWIVWENVPGVLSVDQGRTFGAVLGTLAELGYGFAYRVLDAQFFGVPQRRRRIFVVGHFGDWRAAAAVLFERESLPWGSPSGGQARAESTARLAQCLGGSCSQPGTVTGIAHCLGGSCSQPDVTGSVSAKWAKGTGGPSGDEAYNLICDQRGVRRLTPKECERLQGMPDDWTRIPIAHYPERRVSRTRPEDYWEPCPDGGWWLMAADCTRYRAIGNAMAVPVVRWIGERIQAVERR